MENEMVNEIMVNEMVNEIMVNEIMVNKMELKEHQKECIKKIRENMTNNKRGLIKMFCGSGKSFIIYHSILEFGNTLSVIVVPSINLIEQFNNDYIYNKKFMDYNNRKFNKTFTSISICSKDENSNNNFTTDKNIINNFLENKKNKNILITYKSLPNLRKTLNADECYNMENLP